jgi:RNA polymerase sigma factor (sigma-70 family)
MSDTYLTRHTLLKKLKSADSESSWEEFYKYYKKFIYSIIIKMGVNEADSDDLAQKTLLKIWQALPSFDYNQKRGYFRNWLYTVTRNTVISFIKANKNLLKSQQAFKSINEGKSKAEIYKIIHSEWERYISERAFNTIKGKVSAQALDCFQAGLRNEPVRKTAERLGLEENTVYVYKNRVKQKLYAEIRNLREMLE